jgi:hypothetical protein
VELLHLGTATQEFTLELDLRFGVWSIDLLGRWSTTSAGATRWFCNKVTGGGDQYGDTYTYTISAVKITIAWISTYGDAQGDCARDAGGNWPAILQDKIYIILKPPISGVVFFYTAWKKNIKYLGLELSVNPSRTTVDKVIFKRCECQMKGLNESVKLKQYKLSLCSCGKINRLTPEQHERTSIFLL